MPDDSLKIAAAAVAPTLMYEAGHAREDLYEAVEHMLVALLDEVPHVDRLDALYRLRRAELDLAALAS